MRRLALFAALSSPFLPACDRHEPLPPFKQRTRSAGKRAAGEAAAAMPAAKPTSSPAALLDRVKLTLTPLPPRMDSPTNPITPAKVELGRMLFHDERLSKDKDISCNTCHDLANFGVDVREHDGARARTSAGQGGQRGERNSPTVFNAALALAQFWDGRAADVEEQAGKPILNPIEMAMADEAAVVAVLRGIPGYKDKFAAAFPDEADPISYANLTRAIGAFERTLVTPSRFDRFLQGDVTALSSAELEGLQVFLDAGCPQCHTGPTLGGTQFQKLGSIKPWPDLKDEGRAAVTKSPLDRFVFKVPTLRNVAKTGPWLHDGSIDDLGVMVAKMAEHQAARGAMAPDETKAIVAFLDSLTGEPPRDIGEPALP